MNVTNIVDLCSSSESSTDSSSDGLLFPNTNANNDQSTDNDTEMVSEISFDAIRNHNAKISKIYDYQAWLQHKHKYSNDNAYRQHFDDEQSQINSLILMTN